MKTNRRGVSQNKEIRSSNLIHHCMNIDDLMVYFILFTLISYLAVNQTINLPA